MSNTQFQFVLTSIETNWGKSYLHYYRSTLHLVLLLSSVLIRQVLYAPRSSMSALALQPQRIVSKKVITHPYKILERSYFVEK